MDHLSKQQLILLALLVSFVTSLATGIVTVSLMDQSPEGVGHTILQVVERTIEKAGATGTTTVVANVSEVKLNSVENAIITASKSLVKIKAKDSHLIAGSGIILSKKGIVLADKAVLAQLPDYEVVLSDGTKMPATIVQAQVHGNLVFLAPSANASRLSQFAFSPSTNPTLGQEVFSLSGTTTQVLGQGILTKLPGDDSSTGLVTASIPGSKLSSVSPLFNIKGELIGVHMAGLPSDSSGSSFYSVKGLEAVIPAL
jgi:S1-C subfamily serine protease